MAEYPDTPYGHARRAKREAEGVEVVETDDAVDESVEELTPEDE